MTWYDIDFSRVDTGVYPPELQDYDQWMCRQSGAKNPYAPWTDPYAPAPCSKCNTTTAECDHSARYKWGWTDNSHEFEAAKMSAVDNDIGGLVFIQREDDPFVFVDGDDVRDPESGDVHPGFVSILADLGMSYADISTSGAGVHAYYRGTLPGDMTEASWQLDDDPWRGNDDLPAVEIYSGKHVCVTTGDHISGTHEHARPWDSEALYDLLEDVGEYDTDRAALDSLDASRETGSVSGAAQRAESDSGSDSVDRSPVDAVSALNAQRVAEKTIVASWNDSASTSDGEKAFAPTWGRNSNGTANIVNRDWWCDTGDRGGSGGPIEMAAIDMGILDDRHAEPGAVSGSDWWVAYEHLQELGFDLPDRVDEDEHSDYYNAPLGDYTDGDPWSDPDAMLEACLEARDRGVVEEDADPPALALASVAKDLLGEEEVGDGTRELLAEVYHDELTLADV
jgi:hypothetical protein